MIDEDENKKIIKCIKQGMTIGKISQVLNIPQVYIRESLIKMEKAGIDLNSDSKELNKKTDIIANIDENIISGIDKRILELSEKGLIQDEIAKELNVTKWIISHRVKKLKHKGVKFPEKKNFDEENKQILQMVEEGLSQDEIAKKFDISRSAISMRIKKMKEMGIEIPKKGKTKEKTKIIERIYERDKQILQMLEEGSSQGEIAKKFGVSRQAISQSVQKLKRYGIEISKKKICDKTGKYINLSKEEIEKAILNLAKTRNATFEQMQEIANNYDIDLSRTLYSVDMDER